MYEDPGLLEIFYLFIWVGLHVFYTHAHTHTHTYEPTYIRKNSLSCILTICELYGTYVITQEEDFLKDYCIVQSILLIIVDTFQWRVSFYFSLVKIRKQGFPWRSSG